MSSNTNKYARGDTLPTYRVLWPARNGTLNLGRKRLKRASRAFKRSLTTRENQAPLLEELRNAQLSAKVQSQLTKQRLSQ